VIRNPPGSSPWITPPPFLQSPQADSPQASSRVRFQSGPSPIGSGAFPLTPDFPPPRPPLTRAPRAAGPRPGFPRPGFPSAVPAGRDFAPYLAGGTRGIVLSEGRVASADDEVVAVGAESGQVVPRAQSG
jgi:hypothetical protein